MSFVSYAQNFEDVILRRALTHVERGNYIDVGAQDPVHDSVSLYFYERGWRGVHVEPTPDYASKLRDARPDELVIEAAVSNEQGLIQFHEIPDTGLSTGRSDIAAIHKQAGRALNSITVPTVRLEHVLGMVDGPIHWLKIDVEGMEGAVLESWGECHIRPWILVIEATVPNSQERTHDSWSNEVKSRGYEEVYFDGLSRFYIHREHPHLRDAFDTPPNVFDPFQLSGRHFATFELTKHYTEEVGRRDEELAILSPAYERGKADIAALQSEVQRLEAEAIHKGFEIAHLNEKLEFESERLDETRQALDTLRDTQASIVQQLISTAQEHRRAVELAHALRQAEASDTSARVELARAEEQALQLRVRIDRFEQSAGVKEAQLTEALQSATAAIFRSNTVEQVTSRQLAEMASQLSLVISHRDQADQLIREIVAEPPSPWRRLGHALGIERSSPAHRALVGWSLPLNSESGPPVLPTLISKVETENPMPPQATSTGRNPYLRADTLAELLTWHDVDFVRCAYVTVLGRQPDPDGEAHFAQQIRAGASKLDVLWRLRTSAEGPLHDPGIKGFDRALKRAAGQRRPILGAAARLFNAESDGNSRSDRALRAILNTTSVQQDYLGSVDKRLAAIEWSLS